MKNQLHFAVIGRGPLGLSLAVLLLRMGHRITIYYTVEEDAQSAALNNLATAISGMRFFPYCKYDEKLIGINNAYHDGRKNLALLMETQLIHFGKRINYGIFAFSAGLLGRFIEGIRLLDTHIDSQERSNAYGPLHGQSTIELLHGVDVSGKVFTKSPEIPFSQEEHLRILETNCEGVAWREIAESKDLQLTVDPSRKAGIQIRIDETPTEDDFDRVFVATGRFLPLFYEQLGLGNRVKPKIWKYLNAKFPDDSKFGASVYYDFESHLSIVRHKVFRTNEHCLLINLGNDAHLIPYHQRLGYEAFPGKPTLQERTSYLAKMKKWYAFDDAISDRIDVRNCYLIDFQLIDHEGKHTQPSFEPFVFQDEKELPRVIFGSCFRAILAYTTAEQMIQKAAIDHLPSPKLSRKKSYQSGLRSRPTHIVETP